MEGSTDLSKNFGQLINCLSDIGECEMTLLGVLYKVKDNISENVKKDVEAIARKIRARSSTAKVQLSLLQDTTNNSMKKNAEKDERIRELEKQLCKEKRHNSELNSKYSALSLTYAECKESLTQSQSMISDLTDDFDQSADAEPSQDLFEPPSKIPKQ